MEKLILKKNIKKWIDKNIKNVSASDKILLLGATGAMGSFLAFYLSYLKANLVLAGRNLEELEALKKQCEEFKNDVEIVQVDFANISSVDNLIKYTNSSDVTTIINNIGIYHLPKKMIDGIEQTFLVNYISPFYYFENIKEFIKTKNTKVVNVGSISYKFKDINVEDFECLNTKNKTLRYSQSKSLLMNYGLNLKKEGINSILVHPGISTTNLFLRKHNAYPQIFYIFVVPIMKVLFMAPKKACLTLLKGIDEKEVSSNKWVGPRGLFHSWGYPNLQKLFENKLLKNNEKIKEITLEKIEIIKK